MTQSRRILVLTSRYPYPVISGDRIRIYEICRHLSKTNALTLLSLCNTKDQLESAAPDDGVFSRIERVLLPEWRSILNTLIALPTRVPLQVAYYKSSAFMSRLLTLLPTHDCCLAHLIRTGAYVRHLNIPKVLEMTDAISMSYSRARFLRRVNPLMALTYRLEAPRLLPYERQIVQDFNSVSLVSDVDRMYLEGDGSSEQILIASNGVNTDLFPFRDRRDCEPVIAYIGTMTSAHNLDACLYFATEVLPLARQYIAWRFRIIGRIKERDRLRLQDLEGVEICGNVPDIAAAVGDARVGVAPIRAGAGVKNKILEYMSLGLPVITSSVGLEGLHARPDQELLLANSPDEYAECLRRLWDDQNKFAELARSGYNYVKINHSWSSTLAPLLRAIDLCDTPLLSSQKVRRRKELV